MNFFIAIIAILALSTARSETPAPDSQKKIIKKIVIDDEGELESIPKLPMRYLGVDLVNSVAFEYHFSNKFILGAELPSSVENTKTDGGYSTTSKLVYSPAIRVGYESFDFGNSKGFILFSLGKVEGTGTVNVIPGNPSSSTSGQTLVAKYSHRWLWPHFALGVGGGYRHNTISNVVVPYSSRYFDIKMDQVFGPLFAEGSIYYIF